MKRKTIPRSIEKYLFSGHGHMLVVFHRAGKLVDATMFDGEDMLLLGLNKKPTHNAAAIFDLKTPGGRSMRACVPAMRAQLKRIRGVYEAAKTMKLEVATRGGRGMHPMTLMEIRNFFVGEAISNVKKEEIEAAMNWPEVVLIGRRAKRGKK